MSEKRLFNVDQVLECANMAITLQHEAKNLYAENARLKELNRELYEVVSELSCYKNSPVPNTLIDLAEKVKKKAKEEGE